MFTLKERIVTEQSEENWRREHIGRRVTNLNSVNGQTSCV